MEKKEFVNKINKTVHYIYWPVEGAKASVVISHGMAEHPERYDDLAKYLNDHNIAVYAVYQIGHGEFAEIKGHMGKGDFDQCVTNLSELVEIARNEHKAPTFLLGHSMGSFISQLYAIRYGETIDGLILSGSTKCTPLMKMGATVASLVCAFSKDTSRPSKFMNNLSFGGYNKAIGDVKTEFDWLNRDEKEVQKYIDDPLCGFVCSQSFFKNLTCGTKEMAKPKNLKNVPKNLPIFIHGGSMDPVSNMGKGLYDLKDQYDKLGIEDVSLVVYPGARHEIYNEINKEEVYKNTLNFINFHF